MNDWTNEHIAGYEPRSQGGCGAAPHGPGLGVDVDGGARQAALHGAVMGENLWRNWVGNQACSPSAIAAPGGEDEIASLVVAAEGRGEGVRVAAAGHSVTPLVATDGLLLDLRNLRGVRSIDAARRRAVAGPATTVGDFGDPLWAERLALENQGDIDTQQIAGAIGTGTHGSGLALGVSRRRCGAPGWSTAAAGVIEIGEAEPDLLRAAQVAVGMLGVMTELELQVVPAHRLAERIEHWHFADALDGSTSWPARTATSRSFGCRPSSRPPCTTCDVRLRCAGRHLLRQDLRRGGRRAAGRRYAGRRVDRSYRIYPRSSSRTSTSSSTSSRSTAAARRSRAMRELMLARLPLSVFPLEVRTVAAGRVPSLSHAAPRLVISVSGMPGTAYDPYLREVDRLLGEFDARVHWGKLHFLTREQLLARYPPRRGSSTSAASSTPPAPSLTTTCGRCSSNSRRDPYPSGDSNVACALACELPRRLEASA